MPNWQTDPRAQSMMTLLVAAGVAMYRQRAKGDAARTAVGAAEGLPLRVASPALTVVPHHPASGASHPALINHVDA
jgi:hypothetical protein